MRALTNTGMCVILLSFCAFAGMKEGTKKTRHSFTVGPALPLTNTSVSTIPDSNYKELQLGWEGSWTFTANPFYKSENGLSGLGFGGKVSYSMWERDSTLHPVTFLGAQGIVRYYLPLPTQNLDVFAQVGGGMFVGECGFSDADTVDWKRSSFDPIIKTTQYCPGFNFGAGIDLFVVELMPVITMVFTKNDVSAWLSLNLGMTF
jgi:hypothetical protein